MAIITLEIIDRIVSQQTTLADLKAIESYFRFGSNRKVREAFVKALSEKLSDEQLHKFNSTVMKNTNSLLDQKEDKKFLGREDGMKVFKELLASG